MNEAKALCLQGITKQTAEKLFDLGIEVFLNPSKLRLSNVWTSPFSAKKQDLGEDVTFQSFYDNVKQCNCIKETGLELRCFVDVLELKDELKNSISIVGEDTKLIPYSYKYWEKPKYDLQILGRNITKKPATIPTIYLHYKTKN